MDESDLSRLDRIERRLLSVGLLVSPCLAGATWMLAGGNETPMLFAAVVPGAALAAAYAVALLRARGSSDGTASSGAG